MSGVSAHLTLRPERCNQCGACVPACPNDALRVGQTYVLVDWHACNQCLACVDVCDTGAIARAVVPLRSTAAAPSVPLGDVAKVVVGSRAEAKAVRKAAAQAAKSTPRPAARSSTGPAARRVGDVAAAAASVVPLRAAGEATALPAETAGRAEPAHGKARWGLLDVFAVLALVSATLVAKNAVLGIPAVALMPPGARALTRASVLAIYYVVQIGGLVLLAGRHGRSLSEALGLVPGEGEDRERPGLRSLATTAALTVGLLLAVEVIAVGYGLIVQTAGWRQPLTLSTDVSTVFGGGGLGLVLSVVLVAVVAPITEEFAFRGVVLSGLSERLGMWPSILISSALFAAYHVSAWLFVPMLALGVALGWITSRNDSLWPAIVMHVMYNSLALAAAFLVPR